MSNSGKIYRVIRIDEDLDFGCEERRPDTPLMAVVLLEDDAQNRMRIKQVNQMLYDREINEGDRVCIKEDRTLDKME